MAELPAESGPYPAPDDGRARFSRRTSDVDHGTRLTVIEVQMENLGRRFERHVIKSDQLLEKLDQRADRQDIALARLLAGIAVLMFLGQLAAPVVLKLLGVQT